MISRDDIARRHKRWSARAWIDGQPVTLVEGLPTRILSALRGRSQASLQLRELPPDGGGLLVVVDLVLDGWKSVRFFTGRTDPISVDSAALRRQVNVIDLINLNVAIPAPITWTNRTWPDAVRDLLSAAGVLAEQIDSIVNPGSAYNLGVNYTTTISTRENVAAVLGELLAFGGAAYIVTPTGRVRVVDNPGVPAGEASTIYARAAGSGELPIVNAGWTLEGNEGVVSRYRVTGPRRPDGAIPDATFEASGIAGRAENRLYRFAQTDATCDVLARRDGGRLARARRNGWIETPLNPLILPGDTILLRDSEIGLAENTPAIVLEAATTADGGMRINFAIGASLVDGFTSSNQPPIADFAYEVETQPIVISGSPANRFFVQCRDQSRDPAGRELISRSWAASGTGATPASSTELAPLFFFSSLATAAIALTVTNSAGESNTVTRTIAAPEATTYNRIISAAAGSSGWRVLTNAGWRSWAPPGLSCTAVPAAVEQGQIYAGFDNGALYSSLDALETTPALLATFAGSIRAIWVNEGNPNDLLVAHGASYSRSRTRGTGGFELLRTFVGGDVVADLYSSPTNPDAITVAVGNFIVTTIQVGGGFTTGLSPLLAGPHGGTAQAVSVAPWDGHTAGVFTGGAVPGIDALRIGSRAAGDCTISWDAVAEADRPAGLRSVTHLVGEQSFVAGEARDLIRDPVLGGLILTAATSGGGRLYIITRTGPTSYAAARITTTTATGPGKIINLAAHYQIDTLSATQIGYGPFAEFFAAATTIVSAIGADTRAINLGVDGDPPQGWEQSAFITSGWTAATTSSYDTGLTGAATICAPGAAPTGCVMLTRQTATAPLGAIVRARLRVRADDVAWCYVNGAFVGQVGTESGPADPAAVTTTHTLTVAAALLRPGQPVVIAIRIKNKPYTGSNPMGVAYRLEINYV